MSSPWATPGSAAPQPSTESSSSELTGGGVVGSVESSRSPALSPALPPPPVPLRPMTIPDLLDGSFAIIKRRPRDVLLLAAAFVIPVEILSSWLLRDVLGQSAFSGGQGGPFTLNDTGELVGVGDTLVALSIGMVSLALLAGALGLLVDSWYRGETRTAGDIVIATLRRSPALIIGVVLVHLLEAAGLIGLGVGAYVAMCLLHIVSPVTTVEGVGPIGAISRSVRLTSRRWGASLGVPALVGLIGSLVAFGFQLVPEVAAGVGHRRVGLRDRVAGPVPFTQQVVEVTAGQGFAGALAHRVDGGR